MASRRRLVVILLGLTFGLFELLSDSGDVSGYSAIVTMVDDHRQHVDQPKITIGKNQTKVASLVFLIPSH